MDSNKLSAVIEKKIRHLCLNDFPCGQGSWREDAETDSLLDLLSCPHSPWSRDGSWSHQVPALRQLAALTPQRLHPDSIYTYFTTLRIVNKGVTAIDSGLLKFSKLEELVLSVNKIKEIPVENLPSTLKILEVRANLLCSLHTLTTHPPPARLQYLGLGSNALGSHTDAARLTGRHWPQLVCLDLSDCDFQDQRILLEALRTLPRLRTLVLEGNPFALASSYPGLTVDSLPQLSCLDASWIRPEERRGFRGLADTRGLLVDQASVKVSVGRMGGVPDPGPSRDKNSPDLPVVTFSFYVTYEFLSHRTPIEQTVDRDPDAQTNGNNAELQSNNKCESQTSKAAEENLWNAARVSRHSTSKLAWSACVDFSDTQTYVISDLGGLKKFLNQGLRLSIEEEKVVSWPVAPEEKKISKGKDSSIKSDSAKDKSKDKKKKSVVELVQDAPIKRTLGSVHVPLQSLLKGSGKVHVLCDFGASEGRATEMLKKDLGRKTEEDKELKSSRGRGTSQRTTTSSKGKERKMDGLTDGSMSVQVEFTVELEKWQLASEAPRRPPQPQ